MSWAGTDPEGIRRVQGWEGQPRPLYYIYTVGGGGSMHQSNGFGCSGPVLKVSCL